MIIPEFTKDEGRQLAMKDVGYWMHAFSGQRKKKFVSEATRKISAAYKGAKTGYDIPRGGDIDVLARQHLDLLVYGRRRTF